MMIGDRKTNGPLCRVDLQTVERVKAKMLPLALVRRLAGTFRVLGDPTRIKILDALSKSEFCVCELAGLLGMSSSAVSHQLRVLRDAMLVKYRREGKMVFYSLDDDHVVTLFEQGLEHVTHTAVKPKNERPGGDTGD